MQASAGGGRALADRGGTALLCCLSDLSGGRVCCQGDPLIDEDWSQALPRYSQVDGSTCRSPAAWPLAPTSVGSGAGPTALIPSRRIAYSAHAGGGGTWFAVGSLRLAQVRQCRVRQQGEGQSALGGDGAVAQGARARHPIAGRPLEVVGPSARRMPPPARRLSLHLLGCRLHGRNASGLIFQY